MNNKHLSQFLVAALVAGGLCTLSSAAHAACPFNPDGAGNAAGTATADGLLFIRYALGVTAGVGLGANATQGTALPAAIASYIADPANNAAIDIDGDGKFSPSDAMVIARYLFGFRGNALAVGVPAVEFAKRYGGPSQQTYIDNGCTGLNDLPDPRVTVWNAMNAALVAGNAAQAKTYLTPNGLVNHGQPIDSLLAQMATITASYGSLVARVVSGDYAEYFLTRPIPGSITGEKQVFFVTFLQSPDGTWLIDAM
jgi:hypothetical protein